MLTVLATDTVPGLQIFHAGAWRDVPPRPGCFVVNVGGALSVLDLCNGEVVVPLREQPKCSGSWLQHWDGRIHTVVCESGESFQFSCWHSYPAGLRLCT